MKLLNLLLACFFTTTAMADVINVTDDDLKSAYTTKKPGRISVHDPSIVMDTVSSSTKTIYYVIGSHLGYNRSANLTSWGSNIGGGESSSSNLFGDVNGNVINFANAYSTHAVTKVRNYQGEEVDFGNFDAHGWQYQGFTVQGNQWAADMIWNPKMKKWLIYMSLNGDHWCSSIVCFAADKYNGPFIYQGPVVFSGFQGTYAHNSYPASADWKHTDLQIATGCSTLPSRYAQSSNWGTYWPNCIDPCVFYDEEGNLRMSYGSWSGGIWMIDLDENTGLRDYTVQYPIEYKTGSSTAEQISDPYFGRKIAGGYYVSGEGSYIEHIGDYYYLFMSYGFFSPDGGYQMRIFRSENPDGPYEDCCGTDAVQSGGYQMNYGPNAQTTRGSLLMGGYQWDLMPTAEISQGHNSAFTDLEGRSFIVYHTKFNDGTAGHSIRVHQLFINQDGWLVTAPYEYHGETQNQEAISTTETISDEEIPGNYQLIVHSYKQKYEDMSYQSPRDIVLTASADDPSCGSVTGYGNGSWQRIKGTDFIEITLYNVVYKGVLSRHTIDYSDIPALCFTAVSSSSGSQGSTKQRHVWGSKADAKAAIKYTLDHLSIPVSDGQKVASNLTLPASGKLAAQVSWTSSDTDVITNSGVVKGDGYVTLTLTVSKDEYVYTRTFNITVGNPQGIEDIATDENGQRIFLDLFGRKVSQPETGKIYLEKNRKTIFVE